MLYNRRHFGVLTFVVATVHAALMVDWFVVQNALPDLVTELTTLGDYGKFIGFPFKALGLAALLVLFLMAATSHDFWLAFLTPPAWKALHMALYVAYGLVVMHVALGIMQDERTLLIPAMLVGGFGIVTVLHLVAGFRERNNDRGAALTADGWIAVGAPRDDPGPAPRASSATPGGERIAVFRDGDEIGALTNLCAHQNGPLGEGRIIDGCVTCPWHGYQYRLADGCAPPPFTEKLATYRVRVDQRRGRSRSAPAAARHPRIDHICARDDLSGTNAVCGAMLTAKSEGGIMAEANWVDIGADRRHCRVRRCSTSRCGTRELAVSCKDGQFGVVANACNHVGGPLGEGRLDGDYIVCPWHNWKFHRCTGKGEPGFEEDRGSGLSGEGRERPRAGRSSAVATKRTQDAAPAASAGAQDRARARPDPRRRHFDLADG